MARNRWQYRIDNRPDPPVPFEELQEEIEIRNIIAQTKGIPTVPLEADEDKGEYGGYFELRVIPYRTEK